MSVFVCGFNRSMQYLISDYRVEDAAGEVSNEDLLHGSRQGADVGALAVWATRVSLRLH
jgi:hypothetical protein